MANPQLENGFTSIANELVEALARINLSAYELRVLMAIIRKTYGWQKKQDRISYTQFEELTGLGRWHIARALKSLRTRLIVTCIGNGYKLHYSLQKDYSKWKSLPNKVTSVIVTNRGNTPLPKSVTKSLPKEVNTKTKDNLQKQGGYKKHESNSRNTKRTGTKLPDRDTGYTPAPPDPELQELATAELARQRGN